MAIATAPPPTSAASLSAPAGNDDVVWDRVLQLTRDSIKPVLRPASLPAGLTTTVLDVDPLKPDSHVFQVKYVGPGKTMWLQAGFLNPAPPPGGGAGQPVTVRGRAATLVVEDTSMPEKGSWLYWQEDSALVDGTVAPGYMYELRANGIDPNDLLTVAESLEPYP